MACRGVHFALTKEQENHLLSLKSDDEVLEYIQEDLEESWDEEWILETDKAWDAIHRCLTDGTLKSKAKSILENAILGGTSLYKGKGYIIIYNSAEKMPELAGALKNIKKDDFKTNYYKLNNKKPFLWFNLDSYDGPLNDDDLEYSWAYLEDLKVFINKTSIAKRSLLFTVDQ